MITYCDPQSGRDVVRLTREQAVQCGHSGQCAPDVEANVDEVEWLADDAALRDMLGPYGAWDDLATADQRTLRMRVLWLAASDVTENPGDYPDDGAGLDVSSTVFRIMREQAKYFGGPGG